MENLDQRLQVALGSLSFQILLKDQRIADLEKQVAQLRLENEKLVKDSAPAPDGGAEDDK